MFKNYTVVCTLIISLVVGITTPADSSDSIASEKDFLFLRCIIFDARDARCCTFLEPDEKGRYAICSGGAVAAAERQKIYDQCRAWRARLCCEHITEAMKQAQGGCTHSAKNAGPRPASIDHVARKLPNGPICFGNACRDLNWNWSNPQDCARVSNRGNNDVQIRMALFLQTIVKELGPGDSSVLRDLNGTCIKNATAGKITASLM